MTRQRPATPKALASQPAEQHGGDVRVPALFVRMWAMAHLIHLASANQSRLDTPWNVTAFAAALLVLRWPSRGVWFAVLAGAQIADMVAELPTSPDHWMLVAAVNLAVLVTMLARRTWDLTAVAAAFPAARLLLLVAYAAAVLAKYNTSFLDAGTSCATAIANVASFGLAHRPGVPQPWPWLALAFETSIPVLLAIPATRRHGVRVGMAFHFMLSASPTFAVVDFTAALYALLFLFLPEPEVTRVLDTLGRLGRRSAIVRDARRKPWLTIALAFVVLGLLGYLVSRVAMAVVYVGSELYLVTMLGVALATWRSPTRVPAAHEPARPFGRPLLVQLPVVVLLLLWASNPYLGFRTTGVFTMFSGLRTEGETSNHLFMPAYRLADWQDDLVTIKSSSDAAIDSAGRGQTAVPLMALRRVATDNPELTVWGTLHGRAVDFGPAPGQSPLEPLPWWQYKLLLFRPVSVTEQLFCSNS